MKNMKVLIGIIIVVIVIVLILLLSLLPKIRYIEEEMENLNYGDATKIGQENTYLAQYILGEAIQDYIQYNLDLDKNKLRSVLEEKQNVELEEFDSLYYLKINSIYKMERMNDTTYFVYTTIDNENVYFVINVDYITNAYNIRKTDKSEFENAQENNIKEKYKSSIEISKNEYNTIKKEMPTSQFIINKYFYNYIELQLEKPEIAFTILEKSYKSRMFDNNVENYKQYINNNKEKLLNIAVIESDMIVNENSTKYTITDTYNKTYIITEYNYTDYTIEIQETTIEDEEYMTLKSEEKVEENIKNVYKLLNDKDYESVYNVLDSEFKNINFSTLEEFKTYAEEKFFDYNVLGNITIQEQGQNYVITVPYKDGNSSIAEKRKIKFIMRLQENTDFIISFEK